MIKKIIENIKSKFNCTVLPCAKISNDILSILPDDIEEFYTLCGGMILFEDKPYSVLGG